MEGFRADDDRQLSHGRRISNLADRQRLSMYDEAGPSS